jgi:hypothetical protein
MKPDMITAPTGAAPRLLDPKLPPIGREGVAEEEIEDEFSDDGENDEAGDAPDLEDVEPGSDADAAN